MCSLIVGNCELCLGGVQPLRHMKLMHRSTIRLAPRKPHAVFWRMVIMQPLIPAMKACCCGQDRIGIDVSWSRLHLVYEQPQSLAAMRCSISNSGRNSQFRFRARTRFAPQFQLAPRSVSRAPGCPASPSAPGARLPRRILRVDALSIVANPQPEELAVIRDFRLDAAGVRMVKGVPQHLARDPVNLVPKKRRQGLAALLPQ